MNREQFLFIHYTTPQYKVAQEHLRANGFNTITWEYFTGNFGSVLRYLEKIANYVWDKFNIDETEIFTSIIEKKFIGNDIEFEKLKEHPLFKTHTHVIMSCYGHDDIHYELLTVNELVNIEKDLHHAIYKALNS